MEEYSYEEEVTDTGGKYFNINPWWKNGTEVHRKHLGYTIYSDYIRRKFYVDISKQKVPCQRSYFAEFDRIDEAFNLIELISKPVKD